MAYLPTYLKVCVENRQARTKIDAYDMIMCS
jgi:hypothetical protein